MSDLEEVRNLENEAWMLDSAKETITVFCNHRGVDAVKEHINQLMEYLVTVGQWNHSQSTTIAGGIIAVSFLLIFNDLVDEHDIDHKGDVNWQRNFMCYAKYASCLYCIILGFGLAYQMRFNRILLDDKLTQRKDIMFN